MKTRKDLKPGDTCIIVATPRGGPSAQVTGRTVRSVGRLYIKAGSAEFRISDGTAKNWNSDNEKLYASNEEYEAAVGENRRREALRHIIVSKDLHFGLGRLTTDAAERIVAILQDPASQRSA